MLANHFSAEHEVDVVLFSPKTPFYHVEPRVRLWHFIGKRPGFQHLLYYPRAVVFIRSILRKRKPDVLLSFGEWISPFVMVAAMGLVSKVFVFIEGSPIRSLRGISGLLNPIIFPFAEGVVVKSDQAIRMLRDRYRFCRFKVIVNPVDMPQTVPPLSDRRKVIVNVGSIGRLKNQDFLIRAFAATPASQDWELHFVGNGPDRPRLEALVGQMGLADRVSFLGERGDVPQILSNAQVFAFTSLSEGLPNALAEALAHGCACISFDCLTGPAQLIDNEVNGFLVPMGDNDLYIRQLARLLGDDGLRCRFSEQARQNIRDFSRERVLVKFEELIPGKNS